jgi:hypothetical protein
MFVRFGVEIVSGKMRCVMFQVVARHVHSLKKLVIPV